MSAKNELLDRLTHLNAAIKLPQLIDNGIVPSEHNEVANLLRKGLGIVAFNILEDFIKNKSIESLHFLSDSTIDFLNLTESLQESSIFGALSALNFHATILKKEGVDGKTVIQDEALKIHSTKNQKFELSKYSLVYSGSNITSNEISSLIKAFGLNNGWQLMKDVSDRIGGGLPDLAQAYNNAASRRHSSAHSANFQYNYTWLANLKNEILAIAATIDILITARCRQVTISPGTKLDSHDITNALNFRFLEFAGGYYRETKQIGGRSKKNWGNLQQALHVIQPTLQQKNEFLIILSELKRIENWFY